MCNFLQRETRNSEGEGSESERVSRQPESLPLTRDVRQRGDGDLDPVPPPPRTWLGTYRPADAPFALWALQLLASMRVSTSG